MGKRLKPMRIGYFDQALERLDVSRMPPEDQPLARLFAQTLATTLLQLTSRLAAGSLDLSAHAPILSRAAAMGERLSSVPTPVLASFFFELFDRIKELVEPLFEGEGVEIAVGAVETPQETSGKGGIGIEILIGTREEGHVDPALLLSFDEPPKEPLIRIKVLGTVDLHALTELPTDFTFPPSGLARRDCGVFMGIEIEF